MPAHLSHNLTRLLNYRRRFGWRATLARALHEWRRPTPTAVAGGPREVAALLAERFVSLTPLRVFATPAQGRRRITLVTDSINRGSLFGGVGTALLLATQVANRDRKSVV